MNSLDRMVLTGKLVISINDEVVQEVDNLIVTAGKEWLASRMFDASDTVMTHMAIGTGTTAAVVADTTIETEVARQALDVSGGTVSGATVTYTTTFAADVPDVTAPSTSPITEAGLLNAASTGTLLAHTVFPVVNKGETDSMTISWTVTIS